ncbi:MAG: hypothetical protein K9N23_02230 [Akkermansiaceae bacterium]|nr:hypothetical protein [Akkermansiaceae bacterium]MCF7730469.1 hypothetical protein [Akkermansiaceae bacterium]
MRGKCKVSLGPAGLGGENLWPVITGKGSLTARKPMVWVYPEYGGQAAVRIGGFKVLRRDLKTKKPGSWQVYDISKDSAEANNLAGQRQDLIDQAVAILQAQTSDNRFFPLAVPATR